jgi:thioredoxin reductase (NADPH)
VELWIRSVPLRGFDQDMAHRVVQHMTNHGLVVRFGKSPVSLTKHASSNAIEVVGSDAAGEDTSTFDTVLFATGRHPVTGSMGLQEVGVAMDPAGYIIGGGDGIDSETSSVPSIHAIGDALAGRPELTPVAIQAGKRLARRLTAPATGSGGSDAMDYDNVPTVVFTPFEYACVGLSEEHAISQRGAEAVEVFHLAYNTLPLAAAHRTRADGSEDTAACYAKVICERGGSEKVLGMHIFGPSAGDIMQGFAVAFRLGMTRKDLCDTVGLHPTHAEELVTLDRTKRSGVDFVKSSC